MFDKLPSLEFSVNREMKVSLVHFADHVSFRNLSGDSEDTHDYYDNYGCWTKNLNPDDGCSRW